VNEETLYSAEVLDSESTEPAPTETEASDLEAPETTAATEPETLPAEVEPTEEIPETTEADIPETTEYYIPETTEDTAWYTEPEETIPETTEAVVILEYTPVIAESTSIIANIILCGALMIVGVLVGIRLWR
jgi:hypothetical protein